ncbi:hypothetical protein GGH94_000304 [Coemansia aciculifera]|uniref:L domain-like protein n=1 Tax=Coemansia aciculifera TaxID=417176 RepID=A0A9W8IWV0_9FUNG|nr:hypothetical protein GGH94_000304 [Coemansia aciculifera]KAJ2877075.1 hypothetical protein GGH93_000233 [Coemansia aciculifera]
MNTKDHCKEPVNELELMRRVMWSPYPDHCLTIWAASPNISTQSDAKPATHLDGQRHLRQSSQRHKQFWSISRDFRLGDTSSSQCKTTEVLASHRLSFGSQSIRQLIIPLSSIRYLTSLVELRLPQNKLTRLPHSLFMMTQLEILNLENNQLDEHSTEDIWWRGMVNLRVLFLAGNRFRCLPPSLGRIPMLFYIDVSDNPRLTYLPAELLYAPAIGTLAANRCSGAVMRRLISDSTTWLSLPDLFLESPTISKRWSRVPSLSSLCVQRIHAAIAPFVSPEPSTPPESSQVVARYPDSAYQLFAACEEIRRNPADFALSGVLLPALNSASKRYMCTVCRAPVFCSELAIVKTVDHWDVPFAWQCCSTKCQDQAIIANIQRPVDWDL